MTASLAKLQIHQPLASDRLSNATQIFFSLARFGLWCVGLMLAYAETQHNVDGRIYVLVLFSLPFF